MLKVMANQYLCLVIIALLSSGHPSYLHAQQPPCTITNCLNTGRLGDQLITYAKVKWLAYKHDLKVLYQPFKYSDQFVFDDVEQVCTPEKRAQFASVVDLGYNPIDELNVVNKDGVLYSVFLYYKDSSSPSPSRYSDQLILEPWAENDVQFLHELRNLIKPKKPLATVTPAGNCISVAVHIRRGGGYDVPGCLTSWALKFPPDHYYVEQLKMISEMFNDQPLYVHIFTDDTDPVGLLEKYRQAVNKENIVFACRDTENHYDKNVLEDLFSMANFDCLIRSDSSFSIIAQLLTDHAVVTFPTVYTLRNGQAVIEKVSVLVDENRKQDLLAKY